MAYEHTVTNPFAMPGGRTYAIGDKITDEAEADAIHAKHLGRNLARHEVTTPAPKPEKRAEPVAQPKAPYAAAKPVTPPPPTPAAS